MGKLLRCYFIFACINILFASNLNAAVTWFNPLPQGDDLKSVDGQPDRYVAVGNGSRVMVGAEEEWIASSYGDPVVYHDVASPSGNFIVAVGDYGQVSRWWFYVLF